MSRSVAPVKVSPFIKAFRWTFLIFGIFYGVNKWHFLKAYEEREGPKRREETKARNLKRKAEDSMRTKDELTLVGKDMGITEFPPDWEKEL